MKSLISVSPMTLYTVSVDLYNTKSYKLNIDFFKLKSYKTKTGENSLSAI
jgi:hypothetical protein